MFEILMEVIVSKFYRYNVRNGFCILEIRQSKENPSQYILFGDGTAFRTYESPEDAARAVRLGETGYWVWDQLDGPSNPLGLDEWEEHDN